MQWNFSFPKCRIISIGRSVVDGGIGAGFFITGAAGTPALPVIGAVVAVGIVGEAIKNHYF